MLRSLMLTLVAEAAPSAVLRIDSVAVTCPWDITGNLFRSAAA
jgi:hypothetical protein